MGKSALFDLPEDYAFSNHLTRLRMRRDIADPAFVQKQLWFKWAHGEIEPLCKHWVNQSTLPKEELLDLDIALPSVKEQRRISKTLDHIAAHLDDTRARLDTIPAILKRFRMSVLAAACSGKLTEDWRQENPVVTESQEWIRRLVDNRKKRFSRQQAKALAEEKRALRQLVIPDPLDQSDDIPSSWSVCPLATLFSVETGGTPSRKNESYWQGGTIPWVKTGEVQNCDIFDAGERITQMALAESNAKVFPAETLLIAMYGEGKTRGQVGRLKIPAATNQACAALVNEDMDESARSYAYYFCLGQYQKLRDDSVGGNQPNLNLDKVKNWVVAVPPPEEQEEIIRRVGAMLKQADAIEARYRKAKTFTDKLMPSVLAKAFRGELA
ncbi:MAG: restriction endonuclease subunit S [Rhodoferax sp.]|nr:restriction endonuclease subunit S [Rhodoferax sp.]